MQFLRFILLNFFLWKYSYASCLPCKSVFFRSCYHCLNQFPHDRSDVERVSIVCNSTDYTLNDQERFYSIIRSYITRNCTMKTFYFDQFTLWNYLESLSITYARLTYLSPVVLNRSLSFSPILYSIKLLNISHNSIQILNQNFSYYFPSLQKLDLSYNYLTLIRKRTFVNLIHLKEIYLNNNYLKQILVTSFPRQSLRLINLNDNPWHCSCEDVLILAKSRSIPICQTPNQYKYQNASDIARQCLLRRKADIFITTNISNLTCALSSMNDAWKNKINQNLTFLSIWHIQYRRPITIDYLYNSSKKYLICFHFNSSDSESIHTIIPLRSNLSLIKITNQSEMQITKLVNPKLSPFSLGILTISKNILPKSLRTSDKQVLVVWLILLGMAFFIFLSLIYFIYDQHQKRANYQVNTFSNQFIRLKRNPNRSRTICNMKLICRNHKCSCHYRRHDDLAIYSTKLNNIRPLLIQPTQLRYAKIKRIASTKELDKDCSTGEFRTIIKLKSLPDGY